MYGYGYGYYGFDWTYVLLIIGMLLSLAASTRLKKYIFLLSQNQKCIQVLTGAGDSREKSFRAAGLQMYMVMSNFRKPYRSLRSKDKDCKSFRGYL